MNFKFLFFLFALALSSNATSQIYQYYVDHLNGPGSFEVSNSAYHNTDCGNYKFVDSNAPASYSQGSSRSVQNYTDQCGYGSGDVVYRKRNIAIQKNSSYTIEYFYKRWSPGDGAAPRLQLRVNGQNVGEIQTVQSSAWVHPVFFWNAGNTNLMTIEILNYTTGTHGNDFGLDEIRVTGSAPTAAPVAIDDSSLVAAGNSVNVDVSNNDSIPGGLSSIQIINQPTQTGVTVGTAAVTSVNGSPVISYQSPNDATGTVTLTYQITDNQGRSSNATVDIFITQPINAENDEATVKSGSSVTISVLDNDSYPMGLDITGVTILGVDDSGTAAVSSTNQVIYDAPENLSTTVTITYQICDSANQCDSATVSITPQSVNIRIRALLQGALLNTTDNLMRDDLRAAGHLPQATPYKASTSLGNYISKGLGDVNATATTDAFNNRGNDSIVDWVFIQFREENSPSNVVQTRSALIQRDGDVVDVDGISPLRFPGTYIGKKYHISIRHRNHMGAMSSAAIPLVSDTEFDFRISNDVTNKFYHTSSEYDNIEQVQAGDFLALWAGNANGDQKIKYQGPGADVNVITAQVQFHPNNTTQDFNYNNAVGYYTGDVDMNGKVKYQGPGTDTNLLRANVVLVYTLNTQELYNYDLAREQLPTQN